MPEAYITVWSQKMGLDCATVQSRVFWGLRYGPVPEKKTGPCRSPVQSFLETVIQSGPKIQDRTAYKSVQSGPVRGLTVRSGQSNTIATTAAHSACYIVLLHLVCKLIVTWRIFTFAAQIAFADCEQT